MKQFYLAQIVTRDKLIHQGLFYRPSRPGKKAILWVHGLTDNFYGDLSALEEMASQCEREGIGLASFNTRGHDIVASIKKLDPKNPKGHTSLSLGSGYETFTECVYDIDAGITFLVNEGFSQIILAGISTGANKVCYYAGTTKDPRVAGTLLISPISDVPIESKGKEYRKNLARMKSMIRQGNGDALLDGVSYLALTPKRYVSLFEPGSAEDVFDYYAKKPRLTMFSRIKIPLYVIFGEKDEYCDRPVQDILAVFRRRQQSKQYAETVIPGAYHSFGGKEKELVDAMVGWIKTL